MPIQRAINSHLVYWFNFPIKKLSDEKIKIAFSITRVRFITSSDKQGPEKSLPGNLKKKPKRENVKKRIHIFTSLSLQIFSILNVCLSKPLHLRIGVKAFHSDKQIRNRTFIYFWPLLCEKKLFHFWFVPLGYLHLFFNV